MSDRIPKELLASHAIWIGDYASAFDFYMQILAESNVKDALVMYKVNFELAVVSTIIGKHDIAYECLARLEEDFRRVEETGERVRAKTEQSFEKMESTILREFRRTRKFDSERINEMLQYIDEEKDMLALFVSPRYSRSTLKSAIRKAMRIQPPEVLEEGIFKFTSKTDLYRVTGKAYSLKELKLEKLLLLPTIDVLVQSPNAFYVENEDLRIFACLQRDGLALCYHLLQSSRDIVGADKVRTFFRNMTEAFLS
jgi:hypothetical protein